MSLDLLMGYAGMVVARPLRLLGVVWLRRRLALLKSPGVVSAAPPSAAAGAGRLVIGYFSIA